MMKDEQKKAPEPLTTIQPELVFSGWTHVGALLIVGVAGVLCGVPTLPEPFGVDQGIYAYIAERLLEGAVDHRDVFDHKPPAIHFAYAKAFFILGHTMWSIRLLDLLAAVATAMALYVVGCFWISAHAGVIAGVLYLAYYAGLFDWMSRAQPETWVNLMFAAGLAALSWRCVRRGGDCASGGNDPVSEPTSPNGAGQECPARRFIWPIAPLVAGVFLGLGIWFKPTILMLAPVWLFPLGCSVASGDGERWKNFARDLAAAAAGAVAVSVIVLAYYALNGALRDLYEALVVFNVRYHSRLGLLRGWGDFWRALDGILRPLFGLMLLALPAIFALASARYRASSAMGLVWLGLALGTVFWQGSFARNHCVVLLPPLAFLAALTTDRAIRLARNLSGQVSAGERASALNVMGAVFTAALVLFVVFTLIQALAQRWMKFHAVASRAITPEQYYASFWLKGAPGKGGYSFQDLREIAAYLEANTTPDQTIFVWGFRPILAWLAHRRMPTRFCFRYPLTRANNPRWWNEFLGDLDRSPPEFFVVVLDDRGRYHPETSKDALEHNGALSRFLRERYVLDRTMTDFEMWKKNEER
ncbi:MAG: hypothetical protein N3D11_14865 [Candidatus Sumerlaeia bacterium]|nr:hypothetical protein [Candidatus Sumerlaeia bacterium]